MLSTSSFHTQLWKSLTFRISIKPLQPWARQNKILNKRDKNCIITHSTCFICKYKSTDLNIKGWNHATVKWNFQKYSNRKWRAGIPSESTETQYRTAQFTSQVTSKWKAKCQLVWNYSTSETSKNGQSDQFHFIFKFFFVIR